MKNRTKNIATVSLVAFSLLVSLKPTLVADSVTIDVGSTLSGVANLAQVGLEYYKFFQASEELGSHNFTITLVQVSSK